MKNVTDHLLHCRGQGVPGKLPGWAPDAFELSIAYVTDDHLDPQVKMGEAMSHRTRQWLPISFARRMPLGRRPWPGPVAPWRGRKFHQSTQESLVGPPPQQNRAVRTQRRECQPISCRPCGPWRSPRQLVSAACDRHRRGPRGIRHSAVFLPNKR